MTLMRACTSTCWPVFAAVVSMVSKGFCRDKRVKVGGRGREPACADVCTCPQALGSGGGHKALPINKPCSGSTPQPVGYTPPMASVERLDTLDTWTLTSWAHAPMSPLPHHSGGGFAPAPGNARPHRCQSCVWRCVWNGAIRTPVLPVRGQKGVSSASCFETAFVSAPVPVAAPSVSWSGSSGGQFSGRT